MSNKGPRQDNVEQKVVDHLLGLIRSLRSTRKLSYNGIGSLISRTDIPDLKDEQEIVLRIIEILQSTNDQISSRLIFSSLIDEIVGHVIFNYDKKIEESYLTSLAREKIQKLIQYRSNREIDVPLEFFEVDGDPFHIGHVAFYPISHDDREGEWWQSVKHSCLGKPDLDVLSFARVMAPGDWELALDYAESTVREALLLLRGVGFPLTEEEVNQFGTISEFSTWMNLPFRLHKANEAIRIEHSSSVVTRLGPHVRIYRLNTDLLKDVNPEILSTLNCLLVKPRPSLTKIEHKFIGGLRWLGEATKPDALPARFLKLSTALEFLIGGEENIPTRGITATLAERAAFLIGYDKDSRLLIDSDVRKYYRLRSMIVHGNDAKIDGRNFVEFGKLVRKTAFALGRNLLSFKTLDEMQEWINIQKYS